MKIVNLTTNEIGEVADHVGKDEKMLRDLGYARYDEPYVVTVTDQPKYVTETITMPDEAEQTTNTEATEAVIPANDTIDTEASIIFKSEIVEKKKRKRTNKTITTNGSEGSN